MPFIRLDDMVEKKKAGKMHTIPSFRFGAAFAAFELAAINCSQFLGSVWPN